MAVSFDDLADELRLACPSSQIFRDAPLGPRTTYRVGGNAAVLAVVADADDLNALAMIAAGSDLTVLVVGRGSNLLVADEGFDGLAIALGDGFEHEEIDDTRVVAGAAMALPVLARATVAAGLAGFEWAVGVPGSVGGAVRMNAGGHGSDMAGSLVSVWVVDMRSGQSRSFDGTDLDLGYRHSNLMAHQVVVSATLELEPGDSEQSSQMLSEIVRWRRDHQPGGSNAGSVFTNPPADSAGRLIDEAGCGGLRIGSAEVSDKHANFIQADPSGSANDIRALMHEVQRRVVDAMGIDLVPETHLIGFEEEQ